MDKTEITMEQVGKLRDFAGVSYAEAKAALEATGGVQLEALIWLEQHGKIPSAGVSSYSTRDDQTTPPPEPPREPEPTPEEERERKLRQFGQAVRRWLIDDRLEAYDKKGNELQIPLGVALVLLVMAFWLVPVLLIAGYLFGWRFRLAGPDLSREDVNQVMENINDTADQVVSDAKKNWKKDG